MLRPGGRLALADIVTRRPIAARTVLPGRPLGRLHRRGQSDRSLLRRHRGGRTRAAGGPGQPWLPLHQRARSAHERQVRRLQHVAARAQAATRIPHQPHNDPGGLEVSVITDTIRNGVDTEKMFATLDLIKAQPELAKFQFRATNRWIDGSHNRSTIKGFYAAGGEDTTRSEAFEIDAGEPAILLGTDTGANPAEYLLHALAACLTTTIVYVAAARKVRAHVRRVDPHGRHGRARRARRRRRPSQRFRAHRRVVPRRRATRRTRSSARWSSGRRSARPSTTWSPTACRSSST